MKIVLVSDSYNHHQASISRKMWELLNGNFAYIEVMPLEQERVNLGFRHMTDPFVLYYAQDKELCDQWIDQADVMVYGFAPEKQLRRRLRKGKITIKYSERIYKIPPKWYEMPARAAKYYLERGRFQNCYLLCASAFTSQDYNRTKTFPNRMYKWGYFPETKHYHMERLFAQKNKKKILWVGRFLDWKHPDDALLVAERLKKDGYDFQMEFAGTGVMENKLREMAASMGLDDCVTFLGPVPSDQVRHLMEQAGIYLFTSDRYEGWGVVLNESMNSGCAVAASHVIGAVPYLMKHRQNGLIYPSGNVDALYEQVKYLLDNPAEQERLGRAAYETMTGLWNADVAAERLLALSEHLLAGEKHPDLYAEGPCSKSEILPNDWDFT